MAEPTATATLPRPVITLNEARALIPSPGATEATAARPTRAGPTPTAPLPTPSPEPSPQPTAGPPPEPAAYLVQPGDTLIAIAEQFGVTVEALSYANGAEGPGGFTLIAGSEIQIPLCEAHRITAGNTLSGIAGLCGVTLDPLITANIRTLAPFGSLDAVPLGVVLVIPQDTEDPAGADCDAQPAREQVIEYLPRGGEGIFCLSGKFGVSTTTLIQANIDRLTGDLDYGEEMLLIPPVSGAIYQVTAEDLSAGVTLAALAEWYDLNPEVISDWNLNPVTGPLQEGQQLFLPGANLLFGPFQAE